MTNENAVTETHDSTEIAGANEPGLPPEVLVLKVGTCESLSGRSVLGYQIGYLGAVPIDDSPSFRQAVHFRIYENSGSGLFSDDWVSVLELKVVFDREESELPVSSALLNSVFAGRSVNTAGFMLAVLKAEGLVKQMEDKRRYYVCVKSDVFFNDIWELAKAAIPLGTEAEQNVIVKSERKGKGSKG